MERRDSHAQSRNLGILEFWSLGVYHLQCPIPGIHRLLCMVTEKAFLKVYTYVVHCAERYFLPGESFHIDLAPSLKYGSCSCS